MNKTFFKTGKIALLTAGGILFLSGGLPASETAKKQAELDAACESAREARLAPLRKEYIDECVDKKQRADRASCEAFYADFGAQSGNRAPLFMDLPECVEAFEFRQDNRTR